MNHKKLQKPHRLDDPDFRNAEVALRRAAEKAQERARQAGYEPVIIENKKDKAIYLAGAGLQTKPHEGRHKMG